MEDDDRIQVLFVVGNPSEDFNRFLNSIDGAVPIRLVQVDMVIQKSGIKNPSDENVAKFLISHIKKLRMPINLVVGGFPKNLNQLQIFIGLSASIKILCGINYGKEDVFSECDIRFHRIDERRRIDEAVLEAKKLLTYQFFRRRKNAHTIMEFSPTWYEFKDFLRYVDFVEACGAHTAALCKVIPPPEFQVSHVSDDDKKNCFLTPGIMAFTQKDEVYTMSRRISTTKISLHDFEQVLKSQGYDTPPHKDFQEIEDIYWDTIGKGGDVLYGTDIPHTFMNSTFGSWNFNNLGCLLNHIKDKIVIEGITSPYVYSGCFTATFCFHGEDMSMYSVNFLHEGAPKTWYGIPPRNVNEIRSISNRFGGEVCNEFLKHKTTMPTLQLLDKFKIPWDVTVQNKGDFIITFPDGVHGGWSHGVNLGEAANFLTKRGVDYIKRANFDSCNKGHVNFDITPILKAVCKKEDFENWLIGKDWDTASGCFFKLPKDFYSRPYKSKHFKRGSKKKNEKTCIDASAKFLKILKPFTLESYKGPAPIFVEHEESASDPMVVLDPEPIHTEEGESTSATMVLDPEQGIVQPGESTLTTMVLDPLAILTEEGESTLATMVLDPNPVGSSTWCVQPNIMVSLMRPKHSTEKIPDQAVQVPDSIAMAHIIHKKILRRFGNKSKLIQEKFDSRADFHRCNDEIFNMIGLPGRVACGICGYYEIPIPKLPPYGIYKNGMRSLNKHVDIVHVSNDIKPTRRKYQAKAFKKNVPIDESILKKIGKLINTQFKKCDVPFLYDTEEEFHTKNNELFSKVGFGGWKGCAICGIHGRKIFKGFPHFKQYEQGIKSLNKHVRILHAKGGPGA